MSYKIKTLPQFEKALKRLVKKFPSLKAEYINLLHSLEQNPKLGVDLGKNCYKVRLAIASKGKGKSGGARVITNFIIEDGTVYLLSIYDKSDKENITDKEIEQLLDSIS